MVGQAGTIDKAQASSFINLSLSSFIFIDFHHKHCISIKFRPGAYIVFYQASSNRDGCLYCHHIILTSSTHTRFRRQLGF